MNAFASSSPVVGREVTEQELEARHTVIRDEQRQKQEQQRRRRVEILGNIAKRMRKKTRSGNTTTNEEWDRILRVKELHVLLFSLLGVAVSVFLSFYKWDNRCQYYVENINGTLAPRDRCFFQFFDNLPDENEQYQLLPHRHTLTIANTNSNSVEWLIIVAAQALITASTFVTLALLAQYYSLKLTDRRREWSGMEEIELMESSGAEAERKRLAFRHSYNFWESSLRWSLVVEYLVHVIHPFVWIETLSENGQTFYEVSECFVFARLYLVLRNIYINSDIYIFRSDIIGSNKELERSGFHVGALSTFKIIFFQHPGKTMALLVVSIVLTFGFIIFVVERNRNPQFENLFPDSYWFVWVTIVTIGYGDMAPVSITGKVVVMMMAIVSLLVMTIFSGIVTNLLSPPRNQKYVQSYLSQKKADTEYKKAAVNLIVVSHRNRKQRQWMRNVEAIAGKRSPEVYAAIKRLRLARLALRESIGSASDPVVDLKLQHAIILAHRINHLLDEQGKQIVRLDDKMARSTAFIKSRVARNISGHRTHQHQHQHQQQQASSPTRIAAKGSVE